MDKSSRPVPVVFREWIGESNVPFKVGKLVLQFIEFIHIEHLFETPCPVPVGDLALRIESQELIPDMGTHWRHPCTTTDKYHLVVGFARKELTVGARNGNLVTGFEVENVR